MNLTRKQLKTVVYALRLAIESDYALILCYTNTYTKKSIDPKLTRKVRGSIQRMQTLARAIGEHLTVSSPPTPSHARK
jgi:hypothetical protein